MGFLRQGAMTAVHTRCRARIITIAARTPHATRSQLISLDYPHMRMAKSEINACF